MSWTLRLCHTVRLIRLETRPIRIHSIAAMAREFPSQRTVQPLSAVFAAVGPRESSGLTRFAPIKKIKVACPKKTYFWEELSHGIKFPCLPDDWPYQITGSDLVREVLLAFGGSMLCTSVKISTYFIYRRFKPSLSRSTAFVQQRVWVVAIRVRSEIADFLEQINSHGASTRIFRRSIQ